VNCNGHHWKGCTGINFSNYFEFNKSCASIAINGSRHSFCVIRIIVECYFIAMVESKLKLCIAFVFVILIVCIKVSPSTGICPFVCSNLTRRSMRMILQENY